MRKFVKKQLLDIFRTLYEAHDSVKVLIEKNDTDNAIALLGDCQNTAVQIGDMIDSSEGEGSPVIHFLEEYCETVYQVSVALSENITGIKARKQLDRSLTAAENSAKNDIKVRLEIVFMPYKASMWDSLESVWKAADEDPDCDAYVVPIPYYDRNPDRSFGTFHYEGSLYLDYVPVVHYDNYDLAARKPDIIYIHNPYDYENYATSIDPRFYSDKLKQNTELLIYIPYFATTGGMSEFQATCPAYYNADYIVVQAESFSKFYDEKLPAEKFLNFGSPKFDKVIKICNSALELPVEWKEKINSRKTYFYNTSIGGMLENTDAFMKKSVMFFHALKTEMILV